MRWSERNIKVLGKKEMKWEKYKGIRKERDEVIGRLRALKKLNIMKSIKHWSMQKVYLTDWHVAMVIFRV